MVLDPNALAIVPYGAAGPAVLVEQQYDEGQELLQVVVNQAGQEGQPRAEEQIPQRAHRPANPRRYLNITAAALSLGPAIFWYTHNPLLTSAAILTLLAGFYLGQQCPTGVRDFAATILRGSVDNTRDFINVSKMTLRGMATASMIALRQLNQRNMQRVAAITRFSLNVIRNLLRPNILLTAAAAGSAYMLRNLYHTVIGMIQNFDLQALLDLDLSEGEMIALGALIFSVVAFYAHNFLGGDQFVFRQRNNFERAVERRLDHVENALGIPLVRPRPGEAPGELPVFNAHLENLQRAFERELNGPQPEFVADHGIMYRASRIALYSIFNVSSRVVVGTARLTGRAVSFTTTLGAQAISGTLRGARNILANGAETFREIGIRSAEGVGVTVGGIGALATAAIALAAAIVALPFAGIAAAGYYHPRIIGTIILVMWAYLIMYKYFNNI